MLCIVVSLTPLLGVITCFVTCEAEQVGQHKTDTVSPHGISVIVLPSGE